MIIVVALLQLSASASHAPDHPCDLVAATSGSDAASGVDARHPLRTVQALVDRLAPGQTGCLRGTAAALPFAEDVVIRNKNATGGSESTRITLRSYPGEVAKIRGRLTVANTANFVSLRQLVLAGYSAGAAALIEGDDALIADSNITNTAGNCIRTGLNAQADRVRVLRSRIHDCPVDGIKIGRSLNMTLSSSLVYDNGGTGVKLTADADASWVNRSVIDGNGSGVRFLGSSSTRFADGNFVSKSIIAGSTAGWNIGYARMSGPSGNYVSETCVHSTTKPNGGAQTSPVPQGYQVVGQALVVDEPGYVDRAGGDFRPAAAGDQCFRASGDVASAVIDGKGPNDQQAGAANPRPNILFIVTDDQRANGTVIPAAMPKTSERLVNRGVRFTNAYATTPICCPARASIMTGRYAHNHGVHGGTFVERFNEDATLQAYLKQTPAGYRTGVFGKLLNNWDLDRDPPHWDDWAVLNSGYCPLLVNERGVRKRYPALDAATGGPPEGECTRAELGRTALAPYSTDYLRDRALEFVKRGEVNAASDDQPWFLYLAPTAPHGPSTPEADHASDPMPPFQGTPATFEDASDKPQWIQDRATTPAAVFGNATSPGFRVNQLRALRSVDDMVATLLDDLERRGEQDTLVVFVSDNGYFWGDHGLHGKEAPYAAGAKIPLLIRYPPLTTPGATDARLVANIDLMPTALQLARVPLFRRPPLDGQGLLGDAAPRHRMHNEYYDHGTGDVDWASTRVPGDYLYVETYAEDGETIDFREYYDLASDPYELSNLYGRDGEPGTPDDLGRPEHTADQLHDQLQRDRMCAGSACPPGPGGGTADARRPQTVIKAPLLGATVCCRVRLNAAAGDNVGVDRVEFRVDGNLVATDATAPYEVVWEDTELYAAGPHTIAAIAVDGANNRTVTESAGSTVNVTLDHNGADIQINDGGLPRTSCGPLPPPCNVGTLNDGDTFAFTFPVSVAPGSLIAGWNGAKPAHCSGDPPPRGCVTVGLRADSQVDAYDADTAAIYRDMAGTNPIAALGYLDLGDNDYIGFDTGLPFRRWPRSKMEMTAGNTVVITLAPGGDGAVGNGAGTVRWTTPVCGCQVWESVDGADSGKDREF